MKKTKTSDRTWRVSCVAKFLRDGGYSYTNPSI